MSTFMWEYKEDFIKHIKSEGRLTRLLCLNDFAFVVVFATVFHSLKQSFVSFI